MFRLLCHTNIYSEKIDFWLQNRTSTDPLSLAPATGFQRLLTYQEVAKRYNGKLSLVKVVDGRDIYLEVSTVPDSNQQGSTPMAKVAESSVSLFNYRCIIKMIKYYNRPLII